MAGEDQISAYKMHASPMFERLRNFGWLSAEDLCRIAVGFLITLGLAKYLGPSQFGALSYLTSIIALLIPFTVFGLDAIVLRQLVSLPHTAGPVLGSSLLIRTFGSALAAGLALGFFAIAGGPEGTSFHLMAIAAIGLIAAPWQSLNLSFKAEERVAILALPRTLIVIAAAASTLVLIYRGYSLESFIWLKSMEAVTMALAAVITFITLSRRKVGVTVDTAQVTALARQGLPLFLSAIAVMFYMRVDQIMLGNMADANELGNYSLAVRFSEAAFFIPMALQTAFYPALVRAKSLGQEHFRHELRKYFDLVTGSMIVLVIAVGIASHAIIALALGNEYQGAIPSAWILAAALPLVGIGTARSAYLTIEGKLWVAPLATLIGAAANIGMNFILIPLYGGAGAAIASVLAYWLAAHGTCFILPGLRPIATDISRALNPIGVASRILPPLLAIIAGKRT